jgi:cysteine desulfurase
MVKDMTKLSPIYLDYMASTPTDPRVVQAMIPYMQDAHWCANPSSSHHWLGQQAMKVVEKSREQIAQCVNASPKEFMFTSGATESNNLALFGAARFYKRQGNHLITVLTEHKSVLNVFEQLEKEGFLVTYLTPQPNGLVSIRAIEEAIRPDTILVSVMHVNNEIGVIQDIEAIGRLLKSKGILFHVDAAQSFGRLHIQLNQLEVDLMSFSCHKVYGPKGIGGLYIRQRPRIHLTPLLYGGSQENGLRPGTLALPLIVGMAQAYELAENERESEQQRLFLLRSQLQQAIDDIGGVHWHGDLQYRVAGNLNVSFEGVDGSDLISSLYPLIVSNQSACSASLESSSHVLAALGVPLALARSCLRISLGRFTKSSEIKQTCDILARVIPLLRRQ